MNKAKQDWLKRISEAYNAFSDQSFAVYKRSSLDTLLNSKNITPARGDVFKAFERVPFNKVKVVIIGQDPWPQVPSQGPYATGLAFALNPRVVQGAPLSGLKQAKTLYKILRAASSELNFELNSALDTSLSSWAEQGVLLLNTALTTKPNKAGAHLVYWKGFIAATLLALNKHPKQLLFVLASGSARNLRPLIGSNHLVFINHRHPSRCWRLTKVGGRSRHPYRFFRFATSRCKINWMAGIAL